MHHDLLQMFQNGLDLPDIITGCRFQRDECIDKSIFTELTHLLFNLASHFLIEYGEGGTADADPAVLTEYKASIIDGYDTRFLVNALQDILLHLYEDLLGVKVRYTMMS